jgi:hypothetical protein
MLQLTGRLCGLIVIACIPLGCATVPPEAVTAQQLVIRNIEVARRNQLLLIDSYAADQKGSVRHQLETNALDEVLAKPLNGRAAMPAAEVRLLAIDYAADLQAELGKIDTRTAALRQRTDTDFNQLVQLAEVNALYANALKERSDLINKWMGGYQKELNRIENKFLEVLNTKSQ